MNSSPSSPTKWLPVLLAPWIALTTAHGADAAPDPNLRKAHEASVSGSDGKEVKTQAPEGEFFSKKGVLTLYPGDEVILEFQEKDGKLAEPKVVAKEEHPERTITFKMYHQDGVTGLIRTSAMQQAVTLECMHAVVNGQLARTKLDPTEKGLAQGDSWPGEVWMIQLSKIEATQKPSDSSSKTKE